MHVAHLVLSDRLRTVHVIILGEGLVARARARRSAHVQSPSRERAAALLWPSLVER